MTGSGTFESYVSVGNGCAATPDGRLNGQPTASDFSPQPYAQVHIDESYCIVLLLSYVPAKITQDITPSSLLA